MTRLMKHTAMADVLENAVYLDVHAELIHVDAEKHVVVMRTRGYDTELRIWIDPTDGTALVMGRPVTGKEFQITLDPNVPMSVLLALMEHS